MTRTPVPERWRAARNPIMLVTQFAAQQPPQPGPGGRLILEFVAALPLRNLASRGHDVSERHRADRRGWHLQCAAGGAVHEHRSGPAC